MNRALSVAGLATVAVLGAATVAAAATPAQGTTSVAGVQVTASGWPTGVDDHGDVIGGYNTNGEAHAFIWRAGTFTDIGLPGDDSADAAAINDHGYVVGYVDGDASQNNTQAFVWHNGTTTVLPGPAGADVSAQYINDGGEIVGTVVPSMGLASVVTWKNGTMTTLPGLGSYTVPTGLNRDGEVVGYGYNASGGEEAVAWVDGKIVQLGPGIPLAVNDSGAVLVNNSPLEGPSQAYMWRDGKTTDLPVGTQAYGFNDHGEIVGLYTVPGASTTSGFSWQDGKMTDLGTQNPLAVNNRGQILAYVYDNGLFSSLVLDHGKTTDLLPTSGPSASAAYLSDSGLIAGESETAANVTAWQLPNG